MGEVNGEFMKTAIIAGATGLIGSHLLKMLLESPRYSKVIALSRKPLDLQHAKLENLTTSFSDLERESSKLIGDDIFCCLGTTMKKARSKEAFRKVDLEYPLSLANICKQNGASQYLLVSAMGASASSSFFYNRVKAEAENEISEVGFRTIHIFRPSLLLGNREEERSGEDAAKIFFKIFGFLVPAKYKAINSEKVARAMLKESGKDLVGKYIHESKEMLAL